MTVKTAALPRQQLESAPVAAPLRGRPLRRQLIAFVAVVGVVEVAWMILLFELVRQLV
jgi:hypothetical protein